MKSSLIVSILGILGIILIRGDGYFPFPKSMSIQLLLLIVFFHTCILVYFSYTGCYSLITSRDHSKSHLLEKFQAKFLFLVPLVLFVLIACIHFLQSQRFEDFGYQFSLTSISLFIVLASIPLVIFFILKIKKNYFDPILYLFSVLCSSLILKLFPIINFPITAKRSDMLPITEKAADAFINGQPIYRFFLLDNGVDTPSVRLPGIIMSYCPAVFFNFDLRLINLFFEAAIFTLLIVIMSRLSKAVLLKSGILIVLTVFMLLPYWHLRHELYDIPLWLFLLSSIYALYKKQLILSSILISLMCITLQWGWIFTPFLFIHIMLNWGLKKAIVGGLIVCTIFAATLLLFIQGDFSNFHQNIFGTYDAIITNKSFYPMSMYFSAIASQFNLETYLKIPQGISQLIIFVCAFKYGKNLGAIIGCLAASLTLMLIFNPVAWTYQYLLLVFLLIIGFIFSNLQPVPIQQAQTS